MSQQGIFSIAPDPNGGASQANNGGASPFTPVANEPAQNSPFTAVGQESPFQQVQQSQPEQPRAGIPERRPEGQPPALGSSNASDADSVPQATSETNVFEAVKDNTAQPDPAGGAFQMNGFPEQNGDQVLQAAPVAPAQEASPFAVVQDDRHDYEAAKANLEPQQDFAAVPARYTPAQEPVPAQPSQPAFTPQPVQPPQQPASQAAAQQRQESSSPAYQQLELRAIFGVDHVLDTNEILQRARTLPGIRNVAVVGAHESAALSNFRQAMQSMGFGDSSDLKLNSGGGSVDFLSDTDTTIAVLHEGTYAPGVQETLIIVAREIGKLA